MVDSQDLVWQMIQRTIIQSLQDLKAKPSTKSSIKQQGPNYGLAQIVGFCAKRFISFFQKHQIPPSGNQYKWIISLKNLFGISSPCLKLANFNEILL